MHRHRLLIVEDDRDTCVSLGGVFSRMGWLVRLAATVEEGLEWIAAGHEPCCLILDLGLPDGNGESILELARTKGLRSYVAVCTGISDPTRLGAVEALKPDLFLTKPITASHAWNDVCRIVDDDGATDEMRIFRG